MVRRRVHSGQLSGWLLLGFVSIASFTGAGIWQIVPSQFEGTAIGELQEELDIPYNEFRTVLVRKDAACTIVEHSGMKMLNESILDFHVDFSKDRRPLLNALNRRSKSIVQAKKRITVELEDASLHADNLVLLQDIHIAPEGLNVVSTSEEACGDLKYYQSQLHAEPNGDTTIIKLRVELKISKELGKLFHATAQTQLDEAAMKDVSRQMSGLKHFVQEYAHQ